MPDLSEWLKTPLGRYLMDWERAGLERMVADIFGYRAVQIGLPGVDLLAANRMPFRFRCARVGAAAVLAHEFELPFATASMDLVLMPHVLEFSADPHRVLREVERVLVAEGSVVLSGLNPLSLWGLRRMAARTGGVLPWRGHYRSVMRIKDWLTLLGFEVLECESGCHVPAVRSEKASNPAKSLCQCNGWHHQIKILQKFQLLYPAVQPAHQNSSDDSSIYHKSI